MCVCTLCTDNELYAGTVADFAGTDPIIYREPLQTEQYDSMSLNGICLPTYLTFFSNYLAAVYFIVLVYCEFNSCSWHFFTAPNFVNALTLGDFVYFFFRETAVEYINCGKVNFAVLFRLV